tara:strand:+ start:169 stop:591 length:423 start_codon:yes stop_codon:yes gene_type:complete
MIKKTIIYFFAIFFFFTNLAAEISNFEKGKSLFDENKFDLAKFRFEQDIVFNPKNEKSYLYLAKIYKFKKNDSLEEKNLNTVILLNPKNEEAILNLTLLKIRKSNYSEAKKFINTFKKICKNLCQESFKLQKKLDNIIKN